jgi:hypothetical protein
MSDHDIDLLTDPELPGQILPPDRVFYGEGVLLAADDFRDEQSYHRGRLARVLTYLHGAGTAAGLKAVWQKPLKPGDDVNFPQGRAEELVVAPGLAVDRLGRLIEVPRELCLRLDDWYLGQDPAELDAAYDTTGHVVTADVFIRFVPCERGRTPGFASGPFDALDAAVPSRIRDAFELSLVPRKETPPAPLPATQWPDLTTGSGADRAKHLKEALLAAWHEGTDFLDGQGRLLPAQEHVAGQDTTSVFLARIEIPADPPAQAGERPARTSADVTVDNLGRRFVVPVGALAAWLGIQIP